MFNPQLITQFRQFMQNPTQYMNQMNIPSQLQNNPQGIIQYLMDTGKINQSQFNQIQATARQFQNMLK